MRIKQKLNNNTGVSMILALAFMLVCVVVSSMIVSTAASGLNRTEKRVTQQQEYLAVSSAAELIAKELKNTGEYTGELRVYEPVCQSYYTPNSGVGIVTIGSVSYHSYPLTGEPVPGATHFLLADEGLGTPDEKEFFCEKQRVFSVTTEDTDSFSDVLKEACEEVVTNATAYEKNFTMSVYPDGDPEGSPEERLPEVQCKFVMDTEFDIQVHVSVKEAKSDYAMIVKLQAVVNREETGAVTIASCTHQIRVEYGGNVEMRHEHFEKESPSVNLKITWTDPQIIKGVQ